MIRRRSFRVTVGAWLLVSLHPPAADAQGPPAGSLTLQAAFDQALSRNPTIRAARLGRAVNVAGLAVAAERLNPEATIELEKEAPKQAFGVAVPLELGGKRARRIAVSEATLRTGEASLAATVAQVRNDVRRAYFDLVVADAKLAVLREMRDLSQRTRDAAEARYENGDAARLDLMQADLAVAAAQNDAAAGEGGATAARARLNALLGQPLDTMQALASTLDMPQPIAAASLLDFARANSTELALLDRQIEEQRAKLTLARALRVPDVVPTATLTRDAQPEFSYGWRAGVAFTMPVFTTHRAGVDVEQATLNQLAAQREAAVARITGSVTAAAAAAQAAQGAYQRYRDVILPQAQAVEALAQDAYMLGQTGITALLQALQSTRDVRLRALDTASQLQAAVAELEQAAGAPLP